MRIFILRSPFRGPDRRLGETLSVPNQARNVGAARKRSEPAPTSALRQKRTFRLALSGETRGAVSPWPPSRRGRGFFHFDFQEGKVIATGKESVMKLLSGKASIAKFLLTTFVAAGALEIGFSSTTFAGAVAPSPKTQSALGCLVGLGRDGCQMDFANAGAAWQRTTYCAVQYIHRWLDNCFDGPLETIEYLGTNTAGADVYVVKYMHTIPPMSFRHPLRMARYMGS
jgi:hypothetical protein